MVAAAAGMVLAHHASLFARAPLFDERIYLGAFARRLAGGSAWADPWFLYPPPFAAAGAGLLRLFGETGLLALLRALNLAAVALLVTRGVAFLPGGRWTGRLAAAAVGALSPAIGDAFAFGNLSPLFGALALGLLDRKCSSDSFVELGLAGRVGGECGVDAVVDLLPDTRHAEEDLGMHLAQVRGQLTAEITARRSAGRKACLGRFGGGFEALHKGLQF